MRVMQAVAGLLLATRAMAVNACGYCIEDRIATVYDHAVVQGALEQGHHVAFFAMEGQLAPVEDGQRRIRTIVEPVDGVDKGSVRISLEGAACTLSFDPHRTTTRELQAALEYGLSSMGLQPGLLRIINRPPGAKSAGP
jgi:hypothetical protein